MRSFQYNPIYIALFIVLFLTSCGGVGGDDYNFGDSANYCVGIKVEDMNNFYGCWELKMVNGSPNYPTVKYIEITESDFTMFYENYGRLTYEWEFLTDSVWFRLNNEDIYRFMALDSSNLSLCSQYEDYTIYDFIKVSGCPDLSN